ncbi:MAG: preprotein translocase subunit SecG [Phycisphaerales bacterium]|nr:preprotein translocase subunit SecG [Phycisphaerales bacterium]
MMILAAEWYHGIWAFFFTVLAVLLILVILLQRGRGVGLAGAFGGAGGGGAAFGAKTGDVLTWVTIVAAALLLCFTVILNFVFVPSGPGLGSAQPALPVPAQSVPAGAQPAAPTPVPTPAPVQAVPIEVPGTTPEPVTGTAPEEPAPPAVEEPAPVTPSEAEPVSPPPADDSGGAMLDTPPPGSPHARWLPFPGPCA